MERREEPMISRRSWNLGVSVLFLLGLTFLVTDYIGIPEVQKHEICIFLESKDAILTHYVFETNSGQRGEYTRFGMSSAAYLTDKKFFYVDEFKCVRDLEVGNGYVVLCYSYGLVKNFRIFGDYKRLDSIELHLPREGKVAYGEASVSMHLLKRLMDYSTPVNLHRDKVSF